jgi:hypothetical protein
MSGESGCLGYRSECNRVESLESYEPALNSVSCSRTLANSCNLCVYVCNGNDNNTEFMQEKGLHYEL